MCSTAAAFVSDPCSTMVTRHCSALIETIQQSCPRRAASQVSGWSLSTAKPGAQVTEAIT
jgi:hypothetical protein